MLDEARVLLGPRRLRASERRDLRTYGHIVVDEAQDLTPMQLRMVFRRSLSGSMTVVGDIAQATGSSAPRAWDEVTRHLPHGPADRMVQLSVNYRTPSEIMDVAGHVLAAVAPHLHPPLSVRSTGVQPTLRPVASGALAAEVAEVAKRQHEEVRPGTVAVIAATSMLGALGDALESAGVDFAHADRRGLDAPVTLLAVGVAKGLEFDAVVVAEPAHIVAGAPCPLRGTHPGNQVPFGASRRGAPRLSVRGTAEFRGYAAPVSAPGPGRPSWSGWR